MISNPITEKNNDLCSIEAIRAYFEMPLIELISQARKVHEQYFPNADVQKSMLLSIKTGACPEDCAYCPQSGHYKTNVTKERLLEPDKVLAAVQHAKELGATRFCMGAAWRSPTAENLEKVIELIQIVKEHGMESCVTLGMLTKEQAQQLKEAGLDYYNHNLDTSPEYYQKIITTRTYQDRLDTLNHVSEAQLKVCCGGIIGMGESREDRIQFLYQLAHLNPQPESVPINLLESFEGTPLENQQQFSSFEFIRVVAIARILMPKSRVRLSAGRKKMSQEWQLLCFLAGANSIFIGEKLLTTANQTVCDDQDMLAEFGLEANAPLGSYCKNHDDICEKNS